VLLAESASPEPIVTIGMPTFNDEKYIEKALADLLAQKFSNFELIISDNCSTDATSEICGRYASLDPRIRYVRQSENIGAGNNFLYVLAEAKTEFFMWAAADDRWHPDFLRCLVPALQADARRVVAFCPYQFIDEVEKPIGGSRRFDFSGRTILGRLLRFCWTWDDGFCYGLYRRKLMADTRFWYYGGANSNISINLAYPILVFYLTRGDYVCVGQDPLWYNRLHTQSTTQLASDSRRSLPFLWRLILRKMTLVRFNIGEVYRARGSVLLAASSTPLFVARGLFDIGWEAGLFLLSRLLNRIKKRINSL
jgi:hypothetical protein